MRDFTKGQTVNKRQALLTLCVLMLGGFSQSEASVAMSLNGDQAAGTDLDSTFQQNRNAEQQHLAVSAFNMMKEAAVNTSIEHKAVSKQTNLMPLPASIKENGETLQIGGGIKIEFTGYKDALLDRAAKRFESELELRTGLIPDDTLAHPSMKIEISKPDPDYGSINEKEGYNLTVDSTGIQLKAEGQAGVLHGMATLMQLVELSPDGFQFTGASIEDDPRFPWRGLLIDVARHFVSIDTLKRQIDAMEAVKLNVLHLHLSDNEGFRVESKTFPLLQEKASDGKYYTQDQIRDLIAYATDRGVRILPEFDMPGHSGSEVKAYPNIGTPMGADKPPDGVLDPSRESTYKFVEAFIGEMSKLFPDAYYHMGGDEVGGGSWNDDPHIRQFMQEKGFKNTVELQAYFSNQVKAMLDKQGKTMIGWDEIVNPELSKNVMVHSWRSSKENINTLNAGYPMIISNGYYLDMLSPAEKHYKVDPTDTTGGNNEENWSDDKPKPPDTPPIVLTPEQKSLIKGGEGAMWSELATDEQMDARIWPRMAAIAEKYWSPKEKTIDVDDMYRRLITTDSELSILGLEQHANAERMAARLVPDRPQVLLDFLSAVRPSTNWSHNKPFRHSWNLPHNQQFNELADIAAPDALISKHVELEVKEYLNGNKNNTALLHKIQNQFKQWRDNAEQFSEIASVSPILKDALPRSQDIHDLSVAALEALDMIQNGTKLSDAWLKKQNDLIDQQYKYDDASSSMMKVQKDPQPPADLLITIHPAVQMLVKAAAVDPEFTRKARTN